MYQLISYAIDLLNEDIQNDIDVEANIDILNSLYGNDLNVDEKMHISRCIKTLHDIKQEEEL